MSFNIYQDGSLVKENVDNKMYEVTGLDPNTEYSFAVSEVIGKNESKKSTAVSVTTKYSDVTGVSVSPGTATLDAGSTKTLTSDVQPSTADQSVTWTSDDDTIAKVNSSGKVTAVAKGEATITAKAGGQKDTSTITVTQPVSSVEVSPKTSDVDVDATTKLDATVKPSNANNKKVTYESDSTGIATVDDSGTVTGVSEGEAVITATTDDGSKTDTATVTVNAGDA